MKKSTVALIVVGVLVIAGVALAMFYKGPGSFAASVFGSEKGLAMTREYGSFNYEYAKLPVKSGEVYFDLPIIPFNETSAGKKYNVLSAGNPLRDAWGYPTRPNAYQPKVGSDEKKGVIKNILNTFTPNKAGAFDVDASTPGLVNCRTNTGVTGYFKAYFEDVAVHNGVGYDHSTYGSARRNAACQALQDIASVIKLETTTVTPDILFAVDPGNMPANALAAASSSYDNAPDLITPDDGLLHRHIIFREDPTVGSGNFDGHIFTNFNPSIKWDVDSTLNTATYSLKTVIGHEMMHILGFRSNLNSVTPETNVLRAHGRFDLNLYKDQTPAPAERFFNSVTNYLQMPIGAPSSWFISNTGTYQGSKNILNVLPDGIRPIYTPGSWEQGSSLSHFDMARANGRVYITNPSIGPNTVRSIHDDEKEVLCHMGYMISGMAQCELDTPVAVNDSIVMSGAQMCIQPLINDRSFAGGTLSIQTAAPVVLQTGDAITYYSSSDCTTGLQSNAIGAKSIRITFGSSATQRIMKYTVKGSLSNRVSSEAIIALEPTMACQDTYQYQGKWGSLGSGNGQFHNPLSLDVDAVGNVYVADAANNRIQKFNSTNAYTTQWGTFGTGNGQMVAPQDVGVDSSGNVYVTDSGNNRVQKFDSNGVYITQWGTQGSMNGQFEGPAGIAIDSLGNVYVADIFNSRIQKFNSSGIYITQWGSLGSGNGQFNKPRWIAIDSLNNIYVTDEGNSRIQKFDSNGIYISQWGSYGTTNGQFVMNAYVSGGIAVDSSDNVYVVDLGNSRVQKFTPNGIYIAKWGAAGSGNGQFNYPGGIDIDTAGVVYIADNMNARIQKFATNCDLCSNISGIQISIPTGYIASGTQCVVPGSTISGKVYYDQNTNGIMNTAESGLDGVAVGLFASGSTTPIQTVPTQNISNLGGYKFENVPSGTYHIALINESVYPLITDPAAASTVLAGHSKIKTVTVSGLQSSLNNNFGVVLEYDFCTNIPGVQLGVPQGYIAQNRICVRPIVISPTLPAPQILLPDLIVEDITWTPTNPRAVTPIVGVNPNIQFKVTIKNIGAVDAILPVSTQISIYKTAITNLPSGSQMLLNPVTIPAGQTHVVNVYGSSQPNILSTAGTFNIIAYVDNYAVASYGSPAYAVKESNENNNTLTKPMTVSP